MISISRTAMNAVVNSGVQCQLLQHKRLDLMDTKLFLDAISQELDTSAKNSAWMSSALIAAVGVSMMSDFVIDAVAGGVQSVSSEPQKQALALLQKVYDIARKHKWDGARYQEEIGKIDKVENLLREALPSKFKFLATMFGNMSKNIVLLSGAREDVKELSVMHWQSAHQRKNDVRRLAELIQRIDVEIAFCQPNLLVPKAKSAPAILPNRLP